VIPLLQFEPASMTLWYDAHLFGVARGSRELSLALEYAITGNDRLLRQLVLCTEDAWVQTRAASVASAAWHEKRHFLDFALTNYGALRLRMFFEAYVNVSAVLTQRTTERLLLPLDSNLDPLLREAMDIGELPDDLVQVARAVAARKEMLQQDRRPVPGPFGSFELGGEALLEAVAYHVQMGKAHRVFGNELGARVQKDHPDGKVHHAKYQWAYEVLIRTGLLQVETRPGEVLALDDGPFLPLCYAALAGRFWGQEQVHGEEASSYLPAERLGSLAIAFRRQGSPLAGASTEQAWEIVNRACKELFGRTVVEETRIDIEHGARFVERLEREMPGAPVTRALADLQALRMRLFRLLQDEPLLILDQARWADELVHRLQPLIVTAVPGGEPGDPPPSHQRLSGYRHPEQDAMPEGHWWWAALNKEWPPDEPEYFALHDRDAWTYVASEYAPLGKMMYAGNHLRAMLGPELSAARSRFEVETGVKLVFDPAMAWPTHKHDVAFWYFMTGHDQFRCELSSETVQAPEGCMLDAWELRLRPGLADALLGCAADTDRMRASLWRDWTPWLLSEEFAEYFRSFPPDEAALYRALS
jgi:hypothetical protein